jgi:hypothetical protein
MKHERSIDYGPNSAAVHDLLEWIASTNLLRPHGSPPPASRYTIIADFAEALSNARNYCRGRIGWTETRDNADAELFPAGLLDEPDWLPYKKPIEDLLFLIGDKVHPALPDKYRKIIDDVIADLKACATCVAVNGRLDPFHALLWHGYLCGGWPCGLSCPDRQDANSEQDLSQCRMTIYWESHA